MIDCAKEVCPYITSADVSHLGLLLYVSLFLQLLLKGHLCTNASDIEARFAELATEFYKASEDKMKVEEYCSAIQIISYKPFKATLSKRPSKFNTFVIFFAFYHQDSVSGRG